MAAHEKRAGARWRPALESDKAMVVVLTGASSSVRLREWPPHEQDFGDLRLHNGRRSVQSQHSDHAITM